MGQVTLFFLFIITLVVGVFAYFSPKQRSENPLKTVMVDNDYDNSDGASINRVQELHVSTVNGIVQIRNKIDSLTHEQKMLIGMIDYDKQVLNNTNKEITDILQEANGKSGADVLRLKALGLEIKNDQRLLIAHGQQLLNLNDQLNKNRQLLSDERDMVNINTDSSLQSLHDHDTSQHAQDLIDEENQKAQDQQQMIQQRIEDQKQRIEDQQDR